MNKMTDMMIENHSMRQLTRAEWELMNLLWDRQGQGVTINDLVALYPEPQPAHSRG